MHWPTRAILRWFPWCTSSRAPTRPEVRAQAVNIGALLPARAYQQVHPALVRLLTDRDLAVRYEAAVSLARRQDMACAAALLDLARHEETLEEWRRSNVIQAIQTLTGSYFGLSPGEPSTVEVKNRALEQFERWIAENQGARGRRTSRPD